MSAPNPVAVSEVQAYCDLTGVSSTRERLKHLALIQRLDHTYQRHWAAENKTKT